MQVNWAGNWQDKDTGEFDLIHYPYNVLKDFQESEYSNYILAEFKKLMNLSFDGNVKAAYKPAIGYIDAPKNDIKNAVQQVMMNGYDGKMDGRIILMRQLKNFPQNCHHIYLMK